MGSADGISIQIYHLACTWKMKMKKEDSIKGGVGENRGSEKLEKKHCSNIEPYL